MSALYSITLTRAAKFALLPGKADRFFFRTFVTGAQNWRNVTAGILISRYSMFAGAILSSYSALKAATIYPTLLSASITTGAALQLVRYTKLFMATVDGR